MRLEDQFRQAVEFSDHDRLPEAIALLQEILRLAPRHGGATRLLGVLAHRLKDLDRAEKLLRQSMRFGQQSPELFDELARVFMDKDSWEQAIKCYQRCIELHPDHVDSVINLGVAKNAVGDFAQACDIYEEALKRFPNSYHLWFNLASIHRERGRLKEAVHDYDAMVQRFGADPIVLEARGRAQLQQRNWAEGWRDYEARLQLDSESKVKFNESIQRWNGEPLGDKRIMVLCEQGIGDEVQFASCFNDLVAASDHCTLTCSTRLEPIFKRSFPNATVRSLSNEERLTPQPPDVESFDFAVAAGSLPSFFRQSNSDFPPARYLRPSDAADARNNDPNNANLRVGVSWWGGSLVHQMKQRSIPFECFQQLFFVEHVDFVNLQHGCCDETASQGGLSAFENLRTDTTINPYQDLDRWLDLISTLDLVITVDNSNAHFAGALGIETWLLLPRFPNWRWPLDVSHSQWYERVELFRNESDWGELSDHGWSNLISKIKTKLTQKARSSAI